MRKCKGFGIGSDGGIILERRLSFSRALNEARVEQRAYLREEHSRQRECEARMCVRRKRSERGREKK